MSNALATCDYDLCGIQMHVAAVLTVESYALRPAASDNNEPGWLAAMESTTYADGTSIDVNLWLPDVGELARDCGALVDAEAALIEGHMLIDRLNRRGEPLQFCQHLLIAKEWRALTPEEAVSFKP